MLKYNSKLILDQSWADHAVITNCGDVVMKQWSNMFNSYWSYVLGLELGQCMEFGPRSGVKY